MATSAIIPVPSLSPQGWIVSPAEKADKLFAHIYAAQYSQSHLYPGQITSLQYLVKQYGNEPVEMTLQLQKWLDRYLRRYYPSGVDVRISNDDGPNNPEGKITYTLDIVITEGTSQYSVGVLLNTRDSTLMDMLRINNS